MKLKIIGLVCIVHLSLASNQFFKAQYMTIKELAENSEHLVGKKEPRWYVINVLPRCAAKDATIKDSHNIPVHILEKKLKDPKKWPKNRKIILYSTGKDALDRSAFDILKNLGFVNVFILEGGLAAWKKEGMPLVGKCKLRCLGS